VVGFDDVEIDLARRLVTRGGKLVHLSRTEWLLLSHLAANAGRVVLHGELLTKVWGPEYREDLGYLRVWVSRVRRKLGTPPGQAGRIRTFQGIGYLLDIRDPAPGPLELVCRRSAAPRMPRHEPRRPPPARPAAGSAPACRPPRRRLLAERALQRN
jgi:DNA-binding winged helix-turn-helix (wHTH) protein